MSRTVQGMAIVSIIAWASAAVALGLGDIDVRSRLNQPLSARIAINAAPDDVVDDLKVGIASNEEFKRAGVEQIPYLSTLRFAVKSDGAPYIQVSSDQPAREPFMLLLLDVRDRGNKIVREYSLFLDPAEYVPPESAAADFYETNTEAPEVSIAPAAPAPVVEPAPVASAAPSAAVESPAYEAPTATESEERDVAAAPKATAAPTAAATPGLSPITTTSYGPIGSGETLWSIATRARPQGASMDQVLLAIYTGNPSAFDGGINGLRKGATLQLPDAAAVMAVPAEAAREEVRRLRGLPSTRASRASAVDTAPADSAVTAMTTAAPSPEPTVAPTARPTQRPTAEPTLAPTPEPTIAATLEPTALPTAEATVDDSLEAPTIAATEPTSDAIATADPAVGIVATTDPATAEPEATPEATAKPDKVRRKKEDSSLFGSLLAPLVVGLFVLIGLGLLVMRLLARRKAANDGPAPFGSAPIRAPAPKSSEPVLRKPLSKQSLEDLDRDLDHDAKQSVRAAEAATIAAASTAQFAPEAVSTQRVPALDTETQQIHLQNLPLEQTASPIDDLGLSDTAKGDNLDFDLTGQFEAQTMSINLDTNDPLSEADFHLAYGLYDEAALLLKQAISNDPGRADLRTKLAETYFAAGKPAEFEETARALKPILSTADWQKIAIMGQQLAPGSSFYAVDGANSTADDGGVDLDLGSTSEVGAKRGDTGSMGFMAGDTGDLGAKAGDTGNLAFKLDSFDEPPPVTAPVVETPDIGGSVEFDLGEFDLAAPEPAAAKPAATSAAPDAELLDFDLEIGEPAKAAIDALDSEAAKGNFDAGLAFDLSTSEVQPLNPKTLPANLSNFDATLSTATAETRLQNDDVGLDNVDLGELDGGFAAGGDDAATKLDLARAYVDMGDSEMAQSLLTEVMQQGTDAQKRDANALLQTLG